MSNPDTCSECPLTCDASRHAILCKIRDGLSVCIPGSRMVELQRQLAEAREANRLLEQERDRALVALEPFAKMPSSTIGYGTEDVFYVGFSGGSMVVISHFETACKVVEGLRK